MEEIILDDIKKNIADNISGLRREFGFTQTELAEKLNYSDKAVSKWERGESVPDIATLKQIALLFDVSVDYLISKDNSNKKLRNISVHKKRNHIIITLLATMLVWLIATVVFVAVTLQGYNIKNTWLAFVYAVPVSSIVLLVFNSVWGKGKYNFAIISVLVWSVLISLYLSFLTFAIYNIWLVFMVGIPGQIIIILWSRLKLKKNY